MQHPRLFHLLILPSLPQMQGQRHTCPQSLHTASCPGGWQKARGGWLQLGCPAPGGVGPSVGRDELACPGAMLYAAREDKWHKGGEPGGRPPLPQKPPGSPGHLSSHCQPLPTHCLLADPSWPLPSLGAEVTALHGIILWVLRVFGTLSYQTEASSQSSPD